MRLAREQPLTAAAIAVSVVVTLVFGYARAADVDFPGWANALGLLAMAAAVVAVIWDARRQRRSKERR